MNNCQLHKNDVNHGLSYGMQQGLPVVCPQAPRHAHGSEFEYSKNFLQKQLRRESLVNASFWVGLKTIKEINVIY
jgi:hypothetical protein